MKCGCGDHEHVYAMQCRAYRDALREAADAIAARVEARLLARLDECLTCGKVHTCRRIGPPGQTYTWADPDDGHSYRHDVLAQVERMRAEQVNP